MIESALTAGFLSVGVDGLLMGQMPTPGIAMLTRSTRCDLGVMISGSYNPFADNGIKLFGPDGFKLSGTIEADIEVLIDADLGKHLAASGPYCATDVATRTAAEESCTAVAGNPDGAAEADTTLGRSSPGGRDISRL